VANQPAKRQPDDVTSWSYCESQQIGSVIAAARWVAGSLIFAIAVLLREYNRAPPLGVRRLP